MKKLVGKWFHRKTVIFQMLLLVSLLIIPIYTAVFLYSVKTRNAYVNQEKENIRHILELYIQTLDDRVVSADEYLIRESDHNIDAVRLEHAKNEKEAGFSYYFFWQDLNERLENSVEADGYFFYVETLTKGNVALKEKWDSSVRYDILETVSKMDRKNGNHKWQVMDIAEDKWLVHVLPVGSRFTCGSLINLNSIENEVTQQMSGNKICDIQFQMDMPKEDDSTISVKSEQTDCYLVVSVDISQFLKDMPALEKWGSFFVALYLLFMPLLLYIVYVKMIVPVQRINRAMQRLEANDREYRIKEPGENREAEEMILRFNSMADRLEDLKIQVYEQELEKREIEATNLRLQVNPHFILNCLNTIFSLSRIGNGSDARKFTKYLANYLRFTLWHTSGTVSLGDEMKGVGDYLEIQRVRYPNGFTYLSDIEETAKEARIPSLLVINFVENVIKHGLTMENEVEIIVSAKVMEGKLRISVCDTGNGIEESILKKLQNGEIIKNETGKHIGLWNCRRRLALMYGEACTFHIASHAGEGTQIFVEIPMEVQDESSDRR